eukprot:1394908-Amorphochlora_amoeboformis.AAC.1
MSNADHSRSSRQLPLPLSLPHSAIMRRNTPASLLSPLAVQGRAASLGGYGLGWNDRFAHTGLGAMFEGKQQDLSEKMSNVLSERWRDATEDLLTFKEGHRAFKRSTSF